MNATDQLMRIDITSNANFHTYSFNREEKHGEPLRIKLRMALPRENPLTLETPVKGLDIRDCFPDC